MVPDMMSLVAKEMFKMGMNAVKALSSMPGKIPMKMGKMMTMVRGDI